MFKYVSEVSKTSHYIIDTFVNEKKIAVDATLGNGYDTDFLSENFEKVYSFDIQKCACDNYKERQKSNVEIINDSHHLLKNYVNENISCIMYNLGFMPGGDKTITTNCKTSLESIKDGLELLSCGGIMTICIYRGHEEGRKEEKSILEYVKGLPKDKFGVMNHEVLNRSENAPILLAIEKK